MFEHRKMGLIKSKSREYAGVVKEGSKSQARVFGMFSGHNVIVGIYSKVPQDHFYF